MSLKLLEGGQQGDERDFVRKIKAGQLDGAIVSAVGLAMIEPSIRVLELPALFGTAEEVDFVADKMWPYFQKKFELKGFKLNDRGEVGWVHALTKTKVDSLALLKSQKMWLWADDQIFAVLFKKLGLTGVPLGVSEVDPSLTPGKITAAYGAPVAAVAMQWHTKIKFMTSLPLNFAIGATVIATTPLKKVSAADQKVIADVGDAGAKRLRKAMRKANVDATAVMTRTGVTVVPTPPAMAADVAKAAQEVWKELTGKLFSKEELDMAVKYRDEMRGKKK